MLAGRSTVGGNMIQTVLIVLLMILWSGSAYAQAVRIELTPVLSGLGQTVYFTNAHDGSRRGFIIEQSGRILVLQPGTNVPSVFLDIQSRVLSGGEQGL